MNFIQFKELLEVPEVVVLDPTTLNQEYLDDELASLLAYETSEEDLETEEDEEEPEEVVTPHVEPAPLDTQEEEVIPSEPRVEPAPPEESEPRLPLAQTDSEELPETNQPQEETTCSN